MWAKFSVLRGAMQSIEQLTKEILSLPSTSRAILAEILAQSLELDTDPMLQEAWVNEAKCRRDELQNGSVQSLSGMEALAQVRQLLPHLMQNDLSSAYQLMAADTERECEALEWSNALIGDVANAAR
jgi:Putative addiction module component